MRGRDNRTYPRFYKSDSPTKADRPNLKAVLAPDRMFHLLRGKHGKADGFEFYIYKTRATVLRHEESGIGISFQEFTFLLQTVFAEYILEIQSMIPTHMLTANGGLPGSDEYKRLTG